MKFLEKKYEDIYNCFLVVIASTLIFRKLSTVLIMAFVLFNILFFKKLKYDKKNIVLLIIIASPFLLDVLFFWNNDSLVSGLKSAEKRLTLLIFPLFILGFSKKIDFLKLIQSYVGTMTIILTILFFRYLILYPENVTKYLKGIHLWEMGYHFSSSFFMHAPALNMHVSFVTVGAFFLLFSKRSSKYMLVFQITSFLLSFFYLLIINTRVAVLTSIIGCFIVLTHHFLNKTMKTEKLVKMAVLTILFIVVALSIFAKSFPYVTHKYTKGSFSNLDMVGKLDEFENPEKQIYGKLVTRVTIWKSAISLSKERIFTGFGSSDGKKELIKYYEETDQKFLARNKFPTHNQYIDFLLKFGLLGLLVVLIYILGIGWLGIKLNNPLIISFCVIFFICNFTDDFLIRYDGITFSGLWFSIFAHQFKFLKKVEIE
ncbi:O-antigen ligase family protein [Aquimarina pacifica]|uniref:O-antigen ligase family protein n=1 Tax=Aquimarina pacifica TaxID=1296415 RepID=UPI0004729699|nr:O-antigen ligase family protein [Aquimarina pacifica]